MRHIENLLPFYVIYYSIWEPNTVNGCAINFICSALDQRGINQDKEAVIYMAFCSRITYFVVSFEAENILISDVVFMSSKVSSRSTNCGRPFSTSHNRQHHCNN